jgi:hypothetical protein
MDKSAGPAGIMSKFFFAVASAPVMIETFTGWDWKMNPVNFLVSFAALKAYRSYDEKMKPRETFLDSGAFTAHNTGKTIDIDALCEEARAGGWSTVAALDVIGNAKASFDNAITMSERGLPIIPTFHYSEPWEFLYEYKKRFDWIALGGTVGLQISTKRRWLEQCFARAYPMKFHAFGVSLESILMALPFYSYDVTSWYSGIRFGGARWGKDLAYPSLSIPTVKQGGQSVQNLKHEVFHALKREARIKDRWKAELSWADQPKILGNPPPLIL